MGNPTRRIGVLLGRWGVSESGSIFGPMGQALQTPVHEALRPLQAVPVSAVDSFAVQAFKDMDMEFGMRFEDVEVIAEKFAEVDPHALYELFHDESIIEDGDVSALDIKVPYTKCTGYSMCAFGSLVHKW